MYIYIYITVSFLTYNPSVSIQLINYGTGISHAQILYCSQALMSLYIASRNRYIASPHITPPKWLLHLYLIYIIHKALTTLHITSGIGEPSHVKSTSSACRPSFGSMRQATLYGFPTSAVSSPGGRIAEGMAQQDRYI